MNKYVVMIDGILEDTIIYTTVDNAKNSYVAEDSAGSKITICELVPILEAESVFNWKKVTKTTKTVKQKTKESKK